MLTQVSGRIGSKYWYTFQIKIEQCVSIRPIKIPVLQNYYAQLVRDINGMSIVNPDGINSKKQLELMFDVVVSKRNMDGVKC